ncbi:MAG: hypothetical protein QHJ81_16205 [Anaerolineae bacterium]|nr:hypothetical protein [Anaerolineae bacterium]
MKTPAILTVLVILALSLALSVSLVTAQGPGPQGDAGVQAVLGTAFTYQGQLRSGGNPVSGNCDLQFSLWDAASSGTQSGTTQTRTNVAMSNGYFTIPDLDFGSSAFTGNARWLAIAVRCPAGSGSYIPLSPRQALTAAPYALSLRPGAYIQGPVGFGPVVMADNTSTGLFGWGLGGVSAGGIGVYGKTTASSSPTSGVWGESASSEGRGVSGYATATSGTTYGVYGESASSGGVGVYATGPWRGVVGYATATSGANIGVYGESASTSGTGVSGVNTSSGTGVTGSSSTGDGVRGQSSGANKSGVYGVNTGSGFGVYGASSNGYAGGFKGNVAVFSRATNAVILELGEGLDYAEGFDVSNQDEIPPGTVLVIDPDQPGKLTVSNTPYDRKVAGIITGAKGLGSGVRLGVDQYDYDVALAGRVYCNVDATYGEVSPGDLLTTSPTPGYAMLVKDYSKAQGAILGKAMEGLAAGQKGQILVLVTLQ